MARRRVRQDYNVGWVCALPIELAAAHDMLDEEHQSLPHDPNDTNLYTLGSIGEHNVVLACLPAGQLGANSAAAVALQMRSSFPAIRFGLMVGIGGGVPSAKSDVRLGDVVVSQPYKEHGGVIQYDFGKTTQSGFERTGSLNTPPTVLLSALTKLQAQHLRRQSNLTNYLSTVRYLKDLNAGLDILFESTYNHVERPHVEWPTCDLCSKDKLVKRTLRRTEEVMVHYGTIASGNRVIKDGLIRDMLSSELGGVLCFEMEAAGLMNNFPCLVIRGICDYADSHKNKMWQDYAAATAAAYAKELLSVIPAINGVGGTNLQSRSFGGDEPPIISARASNQDQNTASEFISNFLSNFCGQDSAFLENLAQTATVRAQQATEELGLCSEFTPKLTKLALYDFVILCGKLHPLSIDAHSVVANIFVDDSASMRAENRIIALQETIRCVSEFATLLTSGMSIRFLNFKQDGNFNNLTDLKEIMQKVQMVNYHGNTKLGHWLRMKIVGPMIMKKADNNVLKKPVIVAVITDGEVSLSNALTVMKGARKCLE